MGLSQKLNVAKYIAINAKYITHYGYSIENNIASDIRLSRYVWSTRDQKITTFRAPLQHFARW